MPTAPQINLQEKRDVGQILNATFAFLRICYKYMFKDLLFIAGPLFILSGLVSALNQYGLYSEHRFGTAGTSLFTSPFYYLTILLALVGWALSFCIAGNYVLQYKINGNTDFNTSEIRKAALRDFFKVFLVFILYYLAFILGLVLLIVPGIYFAIANNLAPTNLILDKETSIGDTFGESRRLIKGNWWRTFGLGFITILIIYAFTLVFAIPSGIFNFLVVFHSVGGGGIDQYRLPMLIFGAFAQLAYCLAAPISVVAFCIYYYSLKEEKDQVGLLDKIDKLGNKGNETLVNEGNF